MSLESVQEIIGRAVVDTEYRQLLFSDLDKAIVGYELDENERNALAGLKQEKFDLIAKELEERVSRGGLNIAADILKPVPAHSFKVEFKSEDMNLLNRLFNSNLWSNRG